MSDSRYVLFITLLCAFCNYIGWAEIPDWTIAEIPGFQSSSYPDISGPQVLLNGTNSLGQSGTFLFNAFTETSTYQQTWGPAFRDKDMSGSYIVWEGDDYPKQIYLYDGNSTRVISGAVYDAYRPAISGNYVVWDGHATETSSWGIFLYDISSDTTTNITNYNNGFGATHADISGNKIVWPQGVISPDSEAEQMEIFLYDITTGLTTRVTNDPDPTPQEADTGELNDNYPKISGDNIAWQRGNVNVCQIMLNGTPLTSVDQRTIADSLDISGTNCVWLERDQVNPQWNTHTLYFSDGATTVPMTEPILNTQYGYPAISGNNVVWVQEDSPSKVYLALADGLTDYHWIDDAGGQWNDADNWDHIRWRYIVNIRRFFHWQ